MGIREQVKIRIMDFEIVAMMVINENKSVMNNEKSYTINLSFVDDPEKNKNINIWKDCRKIDDERDC